MMFEGQQPKQIYQYQSMNNENDIDLSRREINTVSRQFNVDKEIIIESSITADCYGSVRVKALTSIRV